MIRDAPTIARLLRDAVERLEDRPHANARLEAEILLADALDKPRSHLFAWPEKQPPPEQTRRFEDALQRRLNGEPVAYILGWREFWSMRLEVTPDTLVPRPETELLVELALQHLSGIPEPRIADLGTGSGAVAAALAQSCRHGQILATDASEAALAVAQRNFRRRQLHNIQTAAGHWCAALAGERRFNLIASNPPYVPEKDPHLQQGDLPWEPASALKAGPEGLDAIRKIIACTPVHLTPDGYLLLEHGYNQGPAVRALLKARGFDAIQTHCDGAGHERVSGGKCPPPEPAS